MEKISKKDVEYVAKLAELEFSDRDIEKFALQLDKILDHVANISSVDTEGVPPTSHILDIKNVFRKDEVKKSILQEDALENAPDRKSDGFRVPKID